MFFAGVYGFLSRRSMLMILISIELMLNAADINFVVFNRYLFPGQLEGFYFALFTIAIAACETAVAIAIIINIYRNLSSVEVGNLDQMKE
jgi:NADH-quinone oxidoreductase subunit K